MKAYLLIGLYSLCGVVPLANASDDWVELFDGKSFKGWTKWGGDATYEIRDGAIVGINGPGHNTFLCTDKSYGNFELRFDVLLSDRLNSGVQIRSKVRPEELKGKPINRVYGPQVEIELPPGEAGYVYGERAGGWLTPKEDLVPHETFRAGEWNHYRILAKGPRIQTWINGKQISDLLHQEIYKDHKEGFIGLQVHQSKSPTGTLKVAWKNIRIRELDTKGWLSLFDGESLEGWTPKITGHPLGENPGNIFRVEGGVIKASHDQFDQFEDRFGHLFYKDSFSRYKLRMEYRLLGNEENQISGGPKWAYRNSGVMLHGQNPADMAIDQLFPNSIEVQFLGAHASDPDRTTGNLCTPGTQFHQNGALVKKHCVGSRSMGFLGDQWVQVEIHVFGSQEIVHYINGDEVIRYQLPQLDDGSLLERGTISLQAESHDCEYRDIEIKPL